MPEDEIYSPHGIRCISHESYRRALYLGRGGPQDQYARIRHARLVCRSHSQKYRYTKNRPIGVTVVYKNGIYTLSARGARVRLGLVALPFPSRAPGDKIRARYSERRAVSKSHLQARKGGPNLCSERETPHPVVRIVRYTCVHMYG